MSKDTKKSTKREPEFIRSALNSDMLNYKVYYMSLQEKITTFIFGVLGGGFIGWVFYGNQFLDDYGQKTGATSVANVILFLIFGFIGMLIAFPMRRKALLEKRTSTLTQQFRSFLDSLAVSLSSGMNMNDSLNSMLVDLKNEYSDDAYIVREVEEMIIGIQNNIDIEFMLQSLGDRSEIEDIKNFSLVFAIAYRAGGNITDIVRRTNNIISQKLEIKEEIKTTLSSNKMQFNVMMVIPVVMMLLLRLMSSAFAASFSTIAGVVSVTIALGFFYGSYKLGNKILNVGEVK